MKSPQNQYFCFFRLSIFNLFSAELISGALLSILYRSGDPYLTTARLHEGWESYIQRFHYWSSTVLILTSLAAILISIWTDRFRREDRYAYLGTVLVFISSMGFQLTGNLLPSDRHGVQTATIEAGISAQAPIVGKFARELTLGGSDFSQGTIKLWYLFHLAITLLALLALAAGFCWKKTLSTSAKGIGPYVGIVFSAVVSLALASPLGHLATTDDANAFADKASWYTQPLHGAMTMMSGLNHSLGWLGSLLMPGAVTIGLLSLPWLFANVSLLKIRWIASVFAAYFLIASVFFGGSFDSLMGTRDPVAVATGPVSKGPAVDASLALQGKAVFNTASIGCASCHGADGKSGGAGPSLTNSYKKHGDSNFYESYIRNPKASNPGSTMPAFSQLTNAQLQQLAEYLRDPSKP